MLQVARPGTNDPKLDSVRSGGSSLLNPWRFAPGLLSGYARCGLWSEHAVEVRF